MDLFELQAVIQLNDEAYRRGLAEAEGQTQSFASKLGSGLGNFAKAAGVAIAGATTAVTAFAKESVGVGMGFDSSMSQVAATMGTTVDQIENLRDFALEMGSSTAFSASQAADALNYMALAGYSAEESMQALPNVLNLAAAGGIDLASASDMVTDAQSALGLSFEETAELVDKMAQAASKSNTSVAQLGDAILTIGATARGVAGGTTELATVLGVLADNGIKGAEGGTHLRNIILSLQTPSEKGALALEQLGMSYESMYDAAGNMRSLPEIFMEMQEAMEGMDQASKDAIISGIFNKTDLASVNALIGTSAERFDELTDSINNAQGAAEKMAETQLDNLAGDITIFQSAMEGAKITISDQLTPSLREFVQFGTKAVSELTEAFKEGGLTGAMQALGPLLSEGLTKIIEDLPDMVEAGVELLKAFVQAIMDNGPMIIDAAFEIIGILATNLLSPDNITNLVNSTYEIITAIVNGIADNLEMMVDASISIIIALVKALTDADNIRKLIDAGIKLAMAVIDALTDTENLEAILEAAVTVTESLMEALAENAPKLIEAATTMIEKLVEYMTTPENIEMVIRAAIKIIVALAKGLYDAMKEIIPSVQRMTGRLGEIFGQGLSNLWSLITQWTEPLLQGFQNIWDGVQQKISDFLEPFRQKFSEITTIVSETWDSLMQTLEPLLTAFQDLFDATFLAIKETASGIWDDISTKTQETWQSISDFVSPIVERLKENVSNAWDNMKERIKETMSRIWDDVRQGFQNIIDRAKEWGRNIIDNLISGLKSGIQNIASVVESIAQKIAAPFQHSVPKTGPFKDELTWMPHMMQNLAKGITDNRGLVDRALESAFSRYDDIIQPRLEPVYAKSSSYGSSRASAAAMNNQQPMTIVVQSVLDGKVIGETSYKYQYNKQRAYGV